MLEHSKLSYFKVVCLIVLLLGALGDLFLLPVCLWWFSFILSYFLTGLIIVNYLPDMLFENLFVEMVWALRWCYLLSQSTFICCCQSLRHQHCRVPSTQFRDWGFSGLSNDSKPTLICAGAGLFPVYPYSRVHPFAVSAQGGMTYQESPLFIWAPALVPLDPQVWQNLAQPLSHQ